MYILGDGKVALVEQPVEGYELPQDDAPLHDRLDSRCALCCFALQAPDMHVRACSPGMRDHVCIPLGATTDGCCVAALCRY